VRLPATPAERKREAAMAAHEKLATLLAAEA
jgi:hypothetical protein